MADSPRTHSKTKKIGANDRSKIERMLNGKSLRLFGSTSNIEPVFKRFREQHDVVVTSATAGVSEPFTPKVC